MQDAALVKVALASEARGQPSRKWVWGTTHELQERLRNLCMTRKAGRKSVADVLHGLGHAIRFVEQNIINSELLSAH